MLLTVPYQNVITTFLTAFIITVCSNIALTQPVANFAINTTSGCAPLTVGFTDMSTGGINTWQWDLGNGTLSNLSDPTAVYVDSGTYTISLVVTNSIGQRSAPKKLSIKVYGSPSVDFTATRTLGCMPSLAVKFTDLSTSNAVRNLAWQWDFGDGNKSSVQNPSHTYTAAGNYTVTLNVTNDIGCSRTISRTPYIKIVPKIKVGFVNSPATLCHPPETINFSNLTTGGGVGGEVIYRWYFGDGRSLIAPNPSYTYTTEGTFDVKLIATSSFGCSDSLTVPAVITIKNTHSDFSGPDSICVGSPASFASTSVPPASNFTWLFDDGTSSTDAEPTKTWDIPGIQKVKLKNNYGTCYDSVSKNIIVSANPVVDFMADDTASCKEPLTVNFSNFTTGAVNWKWDFGDKNTSLSENPSHPYVESGRFDVELTGSSAAGCSSHLIKPLYIQIVKPTVALTNTHEEGCIPYTYNPIPKLTSVDGIAGYFWDFGDGTTSTDQFPTHIYTKLNAYTVKLVITTSDGCIDSTVVPRAVVVGTPPIPDFDASPVVQCVGQEILFKDLSSIGDNWLWDFGDGGTSTEENPKYTYEDTGLFNVKLTVWNSGCPADTTKYKIIKADPPVPRFTPVFNCTDKVRVAFMDESIQPQTWKWDFGDGSPVETSQNPVHTFPAIRSYDVSLTVSNQGCIYSRIVSVKLVDEHPDFSISKNNICRKDSILFTSTNLNPDNITAYNWDFGDGINDFPNSLAIAHPYINSGNYTAKLDITDIHGCSASALKPNLVNVFGPTINFSTTDTAGCKGFTVKFTDKSVSDGTHPIESWIWNYGDSILERLTAPPFIHTYNTPGRFIANLKITDTKGCSDTASFNSPIFITAPTAQFNSTNTLTCTGNTVKFNNVSHGFDLHYFWNFGNGQTSDLSDPVTAYGTDGDYNIKLLVTDTIGCKDSIRLDNYIRVRTPQASFTVNDSSSSCSPFGVIFSNTSLNARTQTWDFGDGATADTSNLTHFYAKTGVYIAKLYIQGDEDCTDSAQQTIYVYEAKPRFSYAPLAGCSPKSIKLKISAVGDFTYLWDMGDGTTFTTSDSNITYTYLLPGRFIPKVVLMESEQCKISVKGVDTVKITRSDVYFAVKDSLFCDSGTVAFTDTTISNGIITNYAWDFGDNETSSLQNPSHTYRSPGLYDVSLIVTTSNGCTDTTIKNDYIKVVSSPAIDIGADTSSCEMSTLDFKGIISVPDTSSLTWHWDFDNNNTSDLQDPKQQYTAIGTYLVQLKVTNSSNCTSNKSKTIVIHPLPATNAGNDTVLCLNTPLQLQASGADSYSWWPSTYLSCINCADPVTTTPYDIKYFVIGTTIYGCITTDSISIPVKKPFRISAATTTASSICSGNSVKLNTSGAENYIWSPPLGLDNIHINNPTATPSTSTVYQVIGFDSAKCFRDTSQVSITVFPLPFVNAGPDMRVNLDASNSFATQYSSDVVKWEWTPSVGLSCTNCPNPVLRLEHNATYTVKVTNKDGCIASDNVTIVVNCENEKIFIPNTFSPNKDGVNDVFYPRGRALYNIRSLVVLGRWGEIIYENHDFAPNDIKEGWDGTYKGKPAKPDVYIYFIEIVCENSDILTFKGNIALIL